MLEARTFVKDFNKTKEILTAQKAVYKGEYKIRDTIFAPKDIGKTLTDEFLRLRVVLKNIWNEKEVIVAIKSTEVKKVGKDASIKLKKEFATREDAQKYIDENLSDSFRYAFTFDRTGWQYDLGEDQVDLEDIEGRCSIEVKSPTEEGLKKLVNLFSITHLIKGPLAAALQASSR